MPVRIINFSKTRVAALEHRGDPRSIDDSVRKFVAWRKENGLPPQLAATFNILYNHPAEVRPEDFRLDICVATGQDIADNVLAIRAKVIPGGRCAVMRHIGSDDTLGESIGTLCAQWLPQSGETRRDYPVFLQRVRFFPEVPKSEAVTDIFLALR